MCDFNVLVKSNYGYAAQCCGCKHLEIAFGTSVMRFHVNHLNKFIDYLNGVKERSLPFANGLKNIMLDIASIDALQLLLTYEELVCLSEMTEQVDQEIKANALLGLFDRP